VAERDSWAVQASGPSGLLDVEECRVAIGALVTPSSASIVKAKSGFRPGPGTSPGLVTATGTPDAFVHVAPFQLMLQSGRASVAGVYQACLDAQKDINVLSTPADPTNPRDDLIIAQQSDTFYGDASSPFQVRQVVGAPSGTPSDPTVTGSQDYVALARVRVDANANTITAAKITDLRTGGHAKSLIGGLYSVAVGGILPVANQAQRDLIVQYDGMTIWRMDLKRIEVYDVTAGAWLNGDWTSYVPVWTTTGTAPALGNGTIGGYWRRSSLDKGMVKVAGAMTFGSSTTFGTGSYRVTAPVAASANAIGRAVGSAYLADVGTQNKAGICIFADANNLLLIAAAGGDVTNNNPHVWAQTDIIRWDLEYEPA